MAAPAKNDSDTTTSSDSPPPAPAVHDQSRGRPTRTVDWFSDEFEPSDHARGSGGFFETLPPGYRFCPEDDELIVCYLRRKVFEKPLPFNRIVDVNIYKYNPEDLADKKKYKDFGEKEWYFFTPRDRKYPKGKRPKRAAGDGYWKATGADRKIFHGGKLVGYRKTLVFYKGKAQCGDKTNWIMHEYRVDGGPPCETNDSNDMMLDKYILSRIYKKIDGVRIKTQTEDPTINTELGNFELGNFEQEDVLDPQVEKHYFPYHHLYPLYDTRNSGLLNNIVPYNIPHHILDPQLDPPYINNTNDFGGTQTFMHTNHNKSYVYKF